MTQVVPAIVLSLLISTAAFAQTRISILVSSVEYQGETTADTGEEVDLEMGSGFGLTLSHQWTPRLGVRCMIFPPETSGSGKTVRSKRRQRTSSLEGATLADLLSWAGRELGLRIRYAEGIDPHQIILHGSLQGLRPDQAIETVLPTTGLTARREGAELIISR